MTRSRLNTTGLKRAHSAGSARGHRALRLLPLASAISAILAGVPVYAATDTDTATLEEVVVTAQKRTENLQDVPISIEVFDSKKMDQLNMAGLDDYVKFSPSVPHVRPHGQGGNRHPATSHTHLPRVAA